MKQTNSNLGCGKRFHKFINEIYGWTWERCDLEHLCPSCKAKEAKKFAEIYGELHQELTSDNKVEKDEVWNFIQSHNDGNPILTPNTIHISVKNLMKAISLAKSSSQKEIDELRQLNFDNVCLWKKEVQEYKNQLSLAKQQERERILKILNKWKDDNLDFLSIVTIDDFDKLLYELKSQINGDNKNG